MFGREDKQVFGVKRNPRLPPPPPPLNKTLVCVCFPVVVFGWVSRLLPGYTGAIKGAHSITEAPIFHILYSSYTSCLFVVCILHTEQTNASSCIPKTQKVVDSSLLQRLLVCFGQLYNEIYIVRNQKFTQVLL